MASAKVSVACEAPPHEVVEIEVTIVGAGICGILAAKHCADRQWPYLVVDRNDELTGVWSTLANKHSSLQARQCALPACLPACLPASACARGGGGGVQQGRRLPPAAAVSM